MLNRPSTWVAPGTAALLVVLVTGWARAAADPAVQGVANRVSETHYRSKRNAGKQDNGRLSFPSGFGQVAVGKEPMRSVKLLSAARLMSQCD